MSVWVPLESNPDVLNKYIQKLGASNKFQIVDVYALEEEALAFIPKPVKAVILLFPCSEAYEAHRSKEDEELKSSPPALPKDLFYLKQVIHNACGTIALTHAILNTPDIDLSDGGILKSFYERTKELSPDERGKILEADTAFTDAHHAISAEGQTAPPGDDEKVNHHFIAFVQKEGELWELDGRKSAPVKHGATSDDTLLEDAARVCKEFMSRDPDEVRFTVLALAAAAED